MRPPPRVRRADARRDFPGLRLVVYPHSLFGLLPRLSWFNIGDQHALRYGHSRACHASDSFNSSRA